MGGGDGTAGGRPRSREMARATQASHSSTCGGPRQDPPGHGCSLPAAAGRAHALRCAPTLHHAVLRRAVPRCRRTSMSCRAYALSTLNSDCWPCRAPGQRTDGCGRKVSLPGCGVAGVQGGFQTWEPRLPPPGTACASTSLASPAVPLCEQLLPRQGSSWRHEHTAALAGGPPARKQRGGTRGRCGGCPAR
jgi:hypothetical protein